jgi:hypothetical protein
MSAISLTLYIISVTRKKNTSNLPWTPHTGKRWRFFKKMHGSLD